MHINDSTKIRINDKSLGGLLSMLMLSASLLTSCQKNTPQRGVEESSALALFKSAIKYQQAGRVELSRKALEKAIDLDPNGKVGNSAKVLLLTKLPKYPVASEAEQRNIIGFNQMNHGDLSAAEKTFSTLIKDFPQFEYPYGNLVYVYIQQRKLNEAKVLLKQVLILNPNYLNGWKYLAEIQRIEEDRSGYEKSVARIKALRLGQEIEADGNDDTNSRSDNSSKGNGSDSNLRLD